MEPQFSLENVKYIFGDQLITQSLLDQLNISSTCVLRCDYYHVINEVWPKYFGQQIFNNISNWLRLMLNSKKKTGNEEKKSMLDNIF